MPKPLADQVVVVIGASSGIGRATAQRFARAGARVVCAARGAQALESLVGEITSSGGQAVAVPTDVADAAAVSALAAAAVEAYGGIDTWVNCAAVGVFGRVEEITDAEFARVLQVNVMGHVHGIQAALPIMRAGGGGVLIGVSSALGARSIPFQSPYTASKWAVRALYDSLRSELAMSGDPIAVTTILPAAIDTPFFEHGRSKPRTRPKPPPPVYAPELVAESIVHAAEHPRREIAVGGAAAGFILGQRLAPGLTDALLSIPKLGRGSQLTEEPDPTGDIVDAPEPGPGRTSGGYPGHVITRSPFTALARRLPRPGELATAAVARLRG
jgi:NAD(P)-dependent dehydrogenase (short-subunit alcohol dehydrogenase family)